MLYRFKVLALCGVWGWLATLAHAVTPTAGTAIVNQSSMTFKDAEGVSWTATSNPVSTTVLQVGAYAVSPGSSSGSAATPSAGNTKNAGAGLTVYSPYVVSNTGNGYEDFSLNVTGTISATSFSKIEIYEDDGTGNPTATAPLCSITAGTNASCANAPVRKLAPGAMYKFVVAYSVPSSAALGAWGTSNANTATVSINPKSGTSWLSSYASYNASTNASAKEVRTDTVTLIGGAMFTAGVAIKMPKVPPVSNLSTLLSSATPAWSTWPTLTNGPRSSASKSIYTTFNLVYANTGAAPGNVYVRGVLPAGLTYVTGSAVSSCAPGAALNEAGNNASVLCNGTTLDFRQSGQTVEAVVPAVAAGGTGSLSFVVNVATTASVGTASTNFWVAYSGAGCADITVAACSASSVSNTNVEAFTVTPNRGVQMGLIDAVAGTPSSAADATSLTRLPAGSADVWAFTVTNLGEATDTFNLTTSHTGVQAGKQTYPAGTTFVWYYADKTTPLTDSNGDGVIDTGAMTAGASQTVHLQVFLPATTTLSASANYEAVVLATSTGDATTKDASYADLQGVVGAWVDVTVTQAYNAATHQAGDWGLGPGAAPVYTHTPVLAGTTVQIPLYLTNNLGVSNTFWFAQGANKEFAALPNGWSAYWSLGACTGAGAASSTISADTQATFNLCVSTSANSPTMTQPLYVKVYSKTDPVVSDTIYLAVSVISNTANAFQLVANNTGTVNKGNSVIYAHTVTNTGANSCAASAGGYFKVTATPDNAAIASGWTTSVYLDANSNGIIDAGDTILTDGKLTSGAALAPGANSMFLVRVYAPSGASPGAISTVTVTVTDVDSTGVTLAPPNGCGTRSVTDTTTVSSGALQVIKSQAKTSGACMATFPGSFSTAAMVASTGDCLYYQVVATNLGASAQSDVFLRDVASNYTTMYSTAITASCVATGLTGTPVAVTVSGAVIACGSSGNSLAPGGTLTLMYAVQVNP